MGEHLGKLIGNELTAGEPLGSATAGITVTLKLRETAEAGSFTSWDDSLVGLPRALLDQLLVLEPASSPSPPLPLTMNTQPCSCDGNRWHLLPCTHMYTHTHKCAKLFGHQRSLSISPVLKPLRQDHWRDRIKVSIRGDSSPSVSGALFFQEDMPWCPIRVSVLPSPVLCVRVCVYVCA